MRTLLSIALCLIAAACAGPGSGRATPWRVLFDGESLEGWESINYGGEGEVSIGLGGALLPRGAVLTGIRYPAGLPRTTGYELEVVSRRLAGNDFFCGLTFPVADSFATVVLGGWGGGLSGLSCLDGDDASMNETKRIRSFEDDRDYNLIVRVEPERIRAWVDRQLLFDVSTAGRVVGLRNEMLPSVPLGISAYVTPAQVSRVRWRPLAED